MKASTTYVVANLKNFEIWYQDKNNNDFDPRYEAEKFRKEHDYHNDYKVMTRNKFDKLESEAYSRVQGDNN